MKAAAQRIAAQQAGQQGTFNMGLTPSHGVPLPGSVPGPLDKSNSSQSLGTSTTTGGSNVTSHAGLPGTSHVAMPPPLVKSEHGPSLLSIPVNTNSFPYAAPGRGKAPAVSNSTTPRDAEQGAGVFPPNKQA